MQILWNMASDFTSNLATNNLEKFVLLTAAGTSLASVCAYGGTFFFTYHPPMVGVAYIGMVALISQIAYRSLEKLKEKIDIPSIQRSITVLQLLQIPFWFYALHGGSQQVLSASVKQEIIAATAYFAAIPTFFYLGIETFNDPTPSNVGATLTGMLTLANGLNGYAGQFK
jgi:hypothetical protein